MLVAKDVYFRLAWQCIRKNQLPRNLPKLCKNLESFPVGGYCPIEKKPFVFIQKLDLMFFFTVYISSFPQFL
jgi:hypothetical protein